VLLIDFYQNINGWAERVPFTVSGIEAGAVRTPAIILLTAGTVVIGRFVIPFDPISKGWPILNGRTMFHSSALLYLWFHWCIT